ncbi:hypothetical protein K440DRAFT_664457 [Wilcoxina mikolae CBS 423.85]|nr:hypothetical protein K440DRAFT_664457 [Wilcoxina mikolae CBS 423.85]
MPSLLQSRAALLSSFTVLLLVEFSCALPQSFSKINGAQLQGQEIAANAQGGGENVGCGFKGNPDVYGLGIRLGLYSQWLSTLISNWFHQHNLTRMRDVNTCFQLAMMIALIALATTNRDQQNLRPHALDLYIIIMQIVGSSCTISAHATHKSKWGETSWGGVVRFFIYFVVAGYSTFFWFSDVQKLRALNDGCEAYGFLFVKVPILKSWFRTIHKIASGGACAVFAVLLGYAIYKYRSEFINRSFVETYRRKRYQKKLSGLEKVLDNAVNLDGELPVIHKYTPALCVFILCVAIAAIECLIMWNQIMDVNEAFSTGQLIPLVTGVGGLVRVLYLMWSEPNLRLHVVHKDRNVRQPARTGASQQLLGTRSHARAGP